MKTILLVEDDADARSIYAEALTERGYRVLTAVHGAEGVHLARKHRPDLILMDIRMPVMDGWQAIRYVKSDLTTAHIPVWAISAFLPEENTPGGRPPAEFDRLFTKPLEPARLAAEVESHVGPASALPLT